MQVKGRTYRLLGRDYTVSNDTWATGLNNNDLIVGPSGAGKTRGYVKPNLLQGGESYIVADTKGNLAREVGPALEAKGYKLLTIDFCGVDSSCGYNPLDYIRREKDGRWNQQDIMTLATALVPLETRNDPFWDYSARYYLAALIAYVMEALPEEEHTLEYVSALYNEMANPQFATLLRDLEDEDPDSFACRLYRMMGDGKRVEKTFECVRMFLAKCLVLLNCEGPRAMYSSDRRLDFAQLGREKTAVFLTVSDTDRSMDPLVNLFYTQAMQGLIRSADRDYPDCRLPVPVRFILDDFATGTVIPDFDNLTSVIRSREIAVSVIIQSLTQLEGLYGKAKAVTIVNNCDHCLYLGGQDVETARVFAEKANRTVDTILTLPRGKAWLFAQGERGRLVDKYDLAAHPDYQLLPEARLRRERRHAIIEDHETNLGRDLL